MAALNDPRDDLEALQAIGARRRAATQRGVGGALSDVGSYFEPTAGERMAQHERRASASPLNDTERSAHIRMSADILKSIGQPFTPADLEEGADRATRGELPAFTAEWTQRMGMGLEREKSRAAAGRASKPPTLEELWADAEGQAAKKDLTTADSIMQTALGAVSTQQFPSVSKAMAGMTQEKGGITPSGPEIVRRAEAALRDPEMIKYLGTKPDGLYALRVLESLALLGGEERAAWSPLRWLGGGERAGEVSLPRKGD